MTTKMTVGEKVVVDTGQGPGGQWYWRLRANPKDIHGPFPTKREADRDSEITLFGPDCKITNSGQWDPAWDQKQ
jgi:hypothetical protein